MGGETETGQPPRGGRSRRRVSSGILGSLGEEEVEPGGELGAEEQAAPQGWDRGSAVTGSHLKDSLADPGDTAGKGQALGEEESPSSLP